MHEIGSDELVERLDRLIGLVALAFSNQIDEASTAIREDELAAGLVDSTSDWTSSGQRQRELASSLGVTTRTVRNKLSDLRTLGVISARGRGSAVEYRATGVLR